MAYDIMEVELVFDDLKDRTDFGGIKVEDK